MQDEGEPLARQAHGENLLDHLGDRHVVGHHPSGFAVVLHHGGQGHDQRAGEGIDVGLADEHLVRPGRFSPLIPRTLRRIVAIRHFLRLGKDHAFVRRAGVDQVETARFGVARVVLRRLRTPDDRAQGSNHPGPRFQPGRDGKGIAGGRTAGIAFDAVQQLTAQLLVREDTDGEHRAADENHDESQNTRLQGFEHTPSVSDSNADGIGSESGQNPALRPAPLSKYGRLRTGVKPRCARAWPGARRSPD